jgi:hypothetical protein
MGRLWFADGGIPDDASRVKQSHRPLA